MTDNSLDIMNIHKIGKPGGVLGGFILIYLLSICLYITRYTIIGYV